MEDVLPEHIHKKVIHGVSMYHTIQAGADPGPQKYMMERAQAMSSRQTQGLPIAQPYFVVLEKESPTKPGKVWKSYGACHSEQQLHLFMERALADNYGVYELIPPGRPCRGALDIEWYTQFDALDDTLGQILRQYADLLSKHGAPAENIVFALGCNSRWVTKGNIRTYKHSYHVIAPRVCFASWEVHQKVVATELVTLLDQNIHKAVDTSIYTSNRLYRIIGSRKPPNNEPLTLVTAPGEPYCLVNARWFWDTTITLAPTNITDVFMIEFNQNALIDHNNAITVPKVQKANKPKATSPSRTVTQNQHPVNQSKSAFVNQLQSLLDSHKLEGTVCGNSETSLFPCRKAAGSRTCMFGPTHDSNNFYLVVEASMTQLDMVRVMYGCHSQQCAGKQHWLGDVLPSSADMSWLIQQNVGALQLYDMEMSQNFHKQYVCDSGIDEQVRLLSLQKTKTTKIMTNTKTQNNEKRCVIINSCMGSGKTQAVEGIMHKWFLQQPRLRVLFVSTRRAFGQGLFDRFRQLNFCLYGPDTMHADRLVCQYESLHKIPKVFDCIILDEIESLTSNVFSTLTNRQNMVANQRAFKLLLGHAQKVIALDANFTDKSVSLLRTIFDPDDMILFNNTFMPETRNTQVYFIDNKQGLMGKDAALDGWFTRMKQDLDDQKGVAIFSASKGFLHRSVLPFLRAYGLPESDIMLYDADQDDQIKASIGQINEMVSAKTGAFALLCSPTITVGTDINVKDKISSVYLYATPNSVNASTILQMAGRVRHPVHSTIHLALCSRSLETARKRWPNPHIPGKSISQSLEHLKDRITSRVGIWKQLASAHPLLDACLDIQVVDDGDIVPQVMDHKLLHAYAHCVYEDLASKYDWLGQFRQLVWRKGWTLTQYIRPADTVPAVPAAHDAIDIGLKRDTQRKADEEAYATAPILDPDELADIEFKVRNNKATKAEKISLEKSKMHAKYGLETLKASEAIRKHTQQLNTVIQAMQNYDDDLSHLNGQYLETALTPNSIKTQVIRQVAALVPIDLSAESLKLGTLENQEVNVTDAIVDSVYAWCCKTANWNLLLAAFPNAKMPPNRNRSAPNTGIDEKVKSPPDHCKALRTWLSQLLQSWGGLSIKRISRRGINNIGVFKPRFKVILKDSQRTKIYTIRELALKRLGIVNDDNYTAVQMTPTT